MKKFLKVCLIVVLIIFTFVLSINIWMVTKYKKNIYDLKSVNDKYDLALVLGCSVRKDGTPSKMLQDRLNKAIEVYEKGLVTNILVSGDHQPNDYDEVDTMKKYLVENGIPENIIITDYKGHNTSQSIINYKNNFKDKSVIVITQKYHLYRSLFLLERYEINGIGIRADKIRYVGDIYREIREFLARFKDFLIN